MTLAQLVYLALLLAGVWLVWDSLRAREAAVRASRAACAAESLLFLDDTVAIRSVWPARDARGQLRLKRVYVFEYSDTGNNRRSGSVTMLGNAVLALHIEAPPGTSVTWH